MFYKTMLPFRGNIQYQISSNVLFQYQLIQHKKIKCETVPRKKEDIEFLRDGAWTTQADQVNNSKQTFEVCLLHVIVSSFPTCY